MTTLTLPTRATTHRSLAAALAMAVGVMASVTAVGTADAGAADPVTLSLWHNSADPPALLDMYDRFEEETGHTIELVSIPSDGFEQTTQTKWATGERPDILEYHATVSNLLSLNPTENLRDLTDEDFVARSGNLYESAGAIDGTVYAAITGFPQVFGLYYNEHVFAEAGLEPPTSFADLAGACSSLLEGDVTPIFEAGGSIWPVQILPLLYVSDANQGNAYGTAIRTHEQSLDDDGSPLVAGLAAYQQLQDDGCFNDDITTATFEDSLQALVDGEAAMVAQHSDMVPALLAAAGDDPAVLDDTVGFVGISAESPTATYAPGPIGTFYLPATGDDDREAAALEFIRFMTGPAYAAYVQAAGVFPVLDDVDPPAGVSQLLLDVKAAYDGPSALAFNSDIPGMGGFAQLMSELIVGQRDAGDVAHQLQGQVAQAAEAAGLPGW